MALVVTVTCTVCVGMGACKALVSVPDPKPTPAQITFSIMRHPNPYSNKSLPCWSLTIVLQLQDASFVATLRWPLNHGY